MNNKQTDWSFRLDGVLHNTSQELTYETVAKKLVSEALTGYNGNLQLLLLFGVVVEKCRDSLLSLFFCFESFLGTIMCYGQTGAGKTYTMTGATAEYKHRGIIPRAVQQVQSICMGKETERNDSNSLVSVIKHKSALTW